MIGLVANCLGVTVESLTTVVLAHEMAHAFTHVGKDIAGHRWSGREFARCNTAMVVRRLQGRIPEAQIAYEWLLAHQPPAYRGHCRWVDCESPEAVRAALLIVRRRGPAGYADFDHEIRKQSRDFGGASQSRRRPMARDE